MVHPVTTRLEDARALVLARAAQLAVETQKMPVMQAMGRISAERVLSLIDLPRTDNAAVDGFAVHADRLAKSQMRP